MTDHPDIVARLRAYTQHNRPVLASDLKEAADKIEWLTNAVPKKMEERALLVDFARAMLDLVDRRLDHLDAADLKRAADELAHLRKTLVSFVQGVQSAAGIDESTDDLSLDGLGRIVDRVGDLRDAARDDLKQQLQRRSELLVGFARDVSEAAGRACWPNNAYHKSDLQGVVNDVHEMRRALGDTRRSLAIADERSGILVDLVRSVSNAVGRKVAPNAFDRADLQHLVDDVAALRRDRDALMPADLETESTAVVAALPIERFDEFERRLALLESSVRMTERRLSHAAAVLAEHGVTGLQGVANVLKGGRDD